MRSPLKKPTCAVRHLPRFRTPDQIPDTESDYFAQSEGPGDGTASNVRGSPPVSTDDDGFQPASDLSVDMGDHVSDKSTRTGAWVDRSSAAIIAAPKEPSGETEKLKLKDLRLRLRLQQEGIKR